MPLRLQTCGDFGEDLFKCVSPERPGDINGWKSSYTNKENIDSLEEFLLAIRCAITSAHSDSGGIREMSLNIVTGWENPVLQTCPSFVFLSCFRALLGNYAPVIIRRLTADPYLACFWWLSDERTIQPFKPQFSSLCFDSIGLFHFPVNAQNVFLATFCSSDYTGESREGWEMKSSVTA